MALENIQEIEKALGLEEGKFNEIITSEDNHSIDISGLYIAKKTDHDALTENLKKTYRQEGVEVAVKTARKDLGLEFEGKKTLTPLLEAYAKKIETDAKIEPNEKYDTLKVDFDKRGGLITEWEGKFNDLQSSQKRKDQQRTIDNTLLNEIPKNTTIPKDDVLAILKAKYDFNIGEDGFEIIKDGQVQKNTANMNLLTAKEFINDFINPYLKTPDGGAGGGDSNNDGKESSLELFNKRMEDKGVNVGSEAYNLEMSKAIKEGTLKF